VVEWFYVSNMGPPLQQLAKHRFGQSVRETDFSKSEELGGPVWVSDNAPTQTRHTSYNATHLHYLMQVVFTTVPDYSIRSCLPAVLQSW
jgi:hypothetical protein